MCAEGLTISPFLQKLRLCRLHGRLMPYANQLKQRASLPLFYADRSRIVNAEGQNQKVCSPIQYSRIPTAIQKMPWGTAHKFGAAPHPPLRWEHRAQCRVGRVARTVWASPHSRAEFRKQSNKQTYAGSRTVERLKQSVRRNSKTPQRMSQIGRNSTAYRPRLR